MKQNVICNAKTDFHVLELFCRASHVRASMHRITSLELLTNTNAVFSATKQMIENARTTMLKSFFLSERKLLNAILRVKLKDVNMCFFLMKWNVICNAEDRFSCVSAFFAEQVMLELQCTESLVLELLRTLMLCVVQLSKLRECKTTDAEKLLSQW